MPPYVHVEEEDYKQKVREISLTTNDTHCPLIKDVMDDISSCDEDIGQMEEVLSDWYMRNKQMRIKGKCNVMKT